MKCDYLTPAGWRTVKADDGRDKAVCKTCGKFVGFYVPAKPEKGK